MHPESVHLLVGRLAVLDLVVFWRDMWSPADPAVAVLAVGLAAAAGASQLFSP